MNFFNRCIGVFTSPQETFKALAEKPVWIDALIVILIAIVLFTHLTMPYTLKDTAQLMENNVKLQERLGDEGFAQTMERVKNPSKASLIARVFVLTPLTIVIGFLNTMRVKYTERNGDNRTILKMIYDFKNRIDFCQP